MNDIMNNNIKYRSVLNDEYTLHVYLTIDEYVFDIIAEFSLLGHGLDNELTYAEHLDRLINFGQNLNVLILYKKNKPVFVAAISPEPIPDLHFSGTTLIIGALGGNCGVQGIRKFMQGLNTFSKSIGAEYYAVPSYVSKYEYRLKYFKVK